MRTLILADRSFAEREQPMLSRLETGLADEGIRVVHAIPASLKDLVETGAAGAAVCSAPVCYEDGGLAFNRRGRVARFLSSLRGPEEPDQESAAPDLVHCFGGAAWPVALEIGAQTGVPVVLEVWRASLIEQAVRVLTGDSSGRIRVVLTTPSPPIAQALRARVAAGRVLLIPWGAFVPDEPHVASRRDGALSIAMLTTGWHARATAPALEAVARIGRGGAGVSAPGADETLPLLFVNSEGARRADIWALSKRLGLQDRVTLVPHFEQRREPVLRCDILLLPEAIGRHHSFTLDALAAGMVVIAREDPTVVSLIDSVTARLVRTGAAEEWAGALREIVSDPDRAGTLRESARRWVRENRTVSSHVRGVIDAYAAAEALASNTGAAA